MRIARTLLVLATVLAAPALLSGCPGLRRGGGGGGGGGASGGGEAGLSAQCRGDFGRTAAAAKIEAFLLAANDFSEAAISVQNDLLIACQRMGRALGMNETDLRASGPGPDATQVVCNAVNERYRSELQAIRGASRVEVRIETVPPHCEVSIDAYAECTAECEARVDPGEIEVTCEGGEIRGQCSAQCQGSCAASVEGQCGGTCEGACDGQCSATQADGSCAGRCEGTCRGQCVVEAQASCQGECRGGCSVEMQEPYCTGRVRPASASARCRASCDARMEAHARCTPGEARMQVSGGMDAAMQARADAVQRATAEGVGAILAIRTRVERLQAAGREIARIAPELPSAAATVGIGAVACATAGAAAVADAMSSVSVSVSVSVEVSASASASASAG